MLHTDSAIELLLRMKDDEGQLILPGAFIPAAERYGLMAQLDRWVITQTFSWIAENQQLTNSLYKLSINLSGQSFSEEYFLDFVKTRLEDFDIDATKICFEITETAAISNLMKATEFISELKALGCSFALDDFGSGFSSFAYLKNLPVDFIKIDGMFVRDIDKDSIDQEMVRSITNIARAMGKHTIAEFVENDAIKKILEGFGVDYIQGYGVSKPQSLELLTMQSMDWPEKISRAQ